jgi:hypothetical protein
MGGPRAAFVPRHPNRTAPGISNISVKIWRLKANDTRQDIGRAISKELDFSTCITADMRHNCAELLHFVFFDQRLHTAVLV